MEPKSIDEIFWDASQIASIGERNAYVNRVCGNDLGMREKLERMLSVRSEAKDFLESPAPILNGMIDEPIMERPGLLLGPYKLLEQIGEGGFGIVFMAEQQRPIHRKVALKVIKPGMDTRQVVARFEAERQALALMDHPNIAHVFDGGETASGRPYFVMELVRGVPVTDYCDQNCLGVRERLELFVSVCHAVQHAHQKGVIHRDLKPTNVLVTMHDSKPVAKVIDFGIAKATGQQLTEKTLFTNFAQMIGTPLYMSPEQAQMSGLDVDTRSDIYSLGVLLYELLTGTTPFDKERLRSAAYDEIRRIIREEEPARPSTRMSTLAQAGNTVSANRGSDAKHLSKLFKGELDWIVMKALEKERDRRYETASAFAADVERYLHDEPVLACPPTPWYRFRKLARRNKAALSITLVVSLAGLTLLAGVVWHNWRLSAKVLEVEKQRSAAGREAQRADANFARALEAVDKFLTQIGHKQLVQVPGMEQIRREVLEEALRFFDGFLRENGDDPAVRREAAGAHYRLALIQNLLGRHDTAEQSYRQAIDLLGQLATEMPDSTQIRSELALCETNLAILLLTIGRSREAEPFYRKAIELNTELAREHPDLPEHRRNLARSYSDMGSLQKFQGQPEAAEKLFRSAIEIQERLAPDHRTEPEYWEDLATSWLNLGLLLKTTGQTKEAEAAYRRSVEVWEGLTAATPVGAGYRYELAGAHLNLGVLLEDTDRRKDAEPSVARARELAGKLVADFPTVPDYQDFLATVQLNYAGLLRHSERLDDAVKTYEKALEIHERLVAQYPEVAHYRRHLAGCLNNLGELTFTMKRLQDAESHFQRSIEVLKELVAKTSGLPADRSELATGYYNLANLLSGVERDKEAEAAYRQARELLEKLVAELPTVVNYRHVLGAVLNNLSAYITERGELAESRKLLEQAVEHQTIALTSNPHHPVYRLFLANHYRRLAEVLVQQGEHSLAVKTAAEASRLFPNKARECLRTARILVICVPLAEKDTRLAEDERSKLANSYADQSVAWLRQAVDNGCRDLVTPTKPPEFDPLRSRADFQQLIKDFKEAKPEEKKPLP